MYVKAYLYSYMLAFLYMHTYIYAYIRICMCIYIYVSVLRLATGITNHSSCTCLSATYQKDAAPRRLHDKSLGIPKLPALRLRLLAKDAAPFSEKEPLFLCAVTYLYMCIYTYVYMISNYICRLKQVHFLTVYIHTDTPVHSQFGLGVS